MRICLLFYLLATKIKHQIKCSLDFLITWIKFYFVCDEFHSFRTSGIPFISTTYRNPGHFFMGNNMTLNNGMSNIQIGFGDCPCIFRAEGGIIRIGENVGLSQSTLVAIDADITIGSNTMLGGGVKVYTTDFHPLNFKYRRDETLNVTERQSVDVTIGNDCFIGAGSFILKGVSIGDRTVVGAGSVVTRSLPSDCVCAGNPCKVIRSLIET